jgi:1-acyl-sn-glycerol-3-phosphate acyltransferase
MPITIRFSRPITFERFADRTTEPRALRQITDEIMFELRDLSGQEYVPTYAKRADPVEAVAPEPARVVAAEPVDAVAVALG